MIKVEDVEVWGWTHALRGMRNPMNSWDKSDTNITLTGSKVCALRLHQTTSEEPHFGEADAKLIHSLVQGGTEHRKFLRQVFVAMDITAPLYWISEFDTYKVGTVRNSCSFMHKGVSKPFEMADFSTHDSLIDGTPKNAKTWETILDTLNQLREEYLDTKDNNIFQQIRCLLPSGYNQRFTVTMNYENVLAIIHQRSGHKLDEWNEFVEVLTNLPGMDVILRGEPTPW